MYVNSKIIEKNVLQPEEQSEILIRIYCQKKSFKIPKG